MILIFNKKTLTSRLDLKNRIQKNTHCLQRTILSYSGRMGKGIPANGNMKHSSIANLISG